MAAIRTRYGKLCVDFRYLSIRCREQKSYWVFLTMLNTFQKVLV